MNELIATYFLLGAFVGLGVGVCWSQKSFRHAIKSKADTGIRLECDGRLFTIHSVGSEE
jgi:hypothetical protein